MRVSVVVPHYGVPALTQELCRNLAAQISDVDVQIIVADDCSPTPFPSTGGVDVVRRPTNGGFGAAVNSGAALASGDLLLVLNSDVTIGPTFIQELVHRAAPWMPAVVSPRVVDVDGVDAWAGRHFPKVRHQVVEWLVPLARWRSLPMLHEAVGHDTVALGRDAVVDWVVGAAMLMPLEAFRNDGGFDENYFMNCEEVDLQRRLRSRGLPSVVLQAPTLIHQGGGSSDNSARRQWLVDARFRYARKWGSSGRLRAGLTAATCTNLIWNVGRRVGGRDIDPLKTARYELELIRRATRS